ncbi:hypothetical protein [Jiangella alkaliphila]|uniref:Uncharacterized protein n=1 Tax=Jiangella alkaliphila TaxID=419479 RepID=A0A1H2L8B5_9ACTN|nr:hypothetical protein [Jiangella alkaliphila]SDU76831.1 hypothetical protein SAMN04488563_5330 [Jiangella alkaliphila]
MCDKPAGHENDPADAKHRRVTDNDEGRAIEWPSRLADAGDVITRAAERTEHSTGSAREALEPARAERERENGRLAQARGSVPGGH